MRSATPILNRADLGLLALLTLFWGVNWPVMKFAVLDYAPLAFRSLSILLGIVALGFYMLARGERFFVPRHERLRVVQLAVGNMMIWHLFAIYALKFLTSGRAAILGYTMPIWALLASVLFFKDRFTWRGSVGVILALSATVLLAIEEFSSLVGQPLGLGLMMVAAVGWGLGTAMMKHLHVSISNAALTFWMMLVTSIAVVLSSLLLEHDAYRWPNTGQWLTIIYNAIIVFGFCHIAWFRLARKLPPVASSLSIMLIPPIGLFTGAWTLNETIGPFDIAALVLILLSMAVVLLPRRRTEPASVSTEPQ